MRNYLTKNRSFLEATVLAEALPFVAGSVNASGFFIVGNYTSHVTGSVAHAGDTLAQGDVGRAMSALFVVVTFFLGAMGATVLIDQAPDPARRRGQGVYTRALLCETAILVAVAFLGVAKPKHVPYLGVITMALLTSAMGLQNAMVTRLSHAVVRTTHMTGIVTDMAIETVHVLRWFRSRARVRAPLEVVRLFLRFRTYPELEKFRLHVSILASFFAGAVVGPFLYLRFGYFSMGLPISVLGLLVWFDRDIGFHSPWTAPASTENTPAPVLVSPGRGPTLPPTDSTG